MIKLLQLLLPALMPSWAFFKAVEASPRIEWRPLPFSTANPPDWQPLLRRPNRLSFGTLIKRLIWNPQWNENLFINSLSERFTLAPTQENLTLLHSRIAKQLGYVDAAVAENEFQFRLVFIYRDGAETRREVTYTQVVQPTLGASE